MQLIEHETLGQVVDTGENQYTKKEVELMIQESTTTIGYLQDQIVNLQNQVIQAQELKTYREEMLALWNT